MVFVNKIAIKFKTIKSFYLLVTMQGIILCLTVIPKLWAVLPALGLVGFLSILSVIMISKITGILSNKQARQNDEHGVAFVLRSSASISAAGRLGIRNASADTRFYFCCRIIKFKLIYRMARFKEIHLPNI